MARIYAIAVVCKCVCFESASHHSFVSSRTLLRYFYVKFAVISVKDYDILVIVRRNILIVGVYVRHSGRIMSLRMVAYSGL